VPYSSKGKECEKKLNVSKNTKRRTIQAASCGQQRPGDVPRHLQHSAITDLRYQVGAALQDKAERKLIFFSSREQDENLCLYAGRWRKVK